jgi:hypothetical protein
MAIKVISSSTIKEKILENIKESIEAISITNGFNNDIESVQRWKQAGNALVHIPAVIINMGPESLEHRPGLVVSAKMTVMIDVWIRHDEEDNPGATDTFLNSLFGDIQKKLMEDHTRGGYAVATRITGNMPFETSEGQSYAGITIEAEVEYRYTMSNPESQVS